jgi:shikimate dehydrogenase
VQYVLAERNIPFSIVSRDKSKGNFTYEELSQEIIASHPLIINSSPVGMYPNVDDAPVLPYEFLTPQHYLFDLVYNPTTTKFMELGARYGAQTLSGLDMLYAQAEAAWAIWNR